MKFLITAKSRLDPLLRNKKILIFSGVTALLLLLFSVVFYTWGHYSATKALEEWVSRQDPESMPETTQNERMVINDNYACDTIKLKTGNTFRCYRKNEAGKFVLDNEF